MNFGIQMYVLLTCSLPRVKVVVVPKEPQLLLQKPNGYVIIIIVLCNDLIMRRREE
jgi:hypothetical protein